MRVSFDENLTGQVNNNLLGESPNHKITIWYHAGIIKFEPEVQSNFVLGSDPTKIYIQPPEQIHNR